MKQRPWSWADGTAIASLSALSLGLYRHIALSNLILSGVDAFTYFYPYRAYAARAVRSGRIPLWNPYLFMGAPYLANPQTAVFYPLNLVLSSLSAPKIVAWSIVLHVAMAATFAYLYARHTVRLSPMPAFLGASAFAFGGFLCGQVGHVNQLNVSAWFPLLLLLWELRSRARWCALLGVGVTIGLGLLAGHAQSTYISLVGLGAYAVLPYLGDIWQALLGMKSGRKRANAYLRGTGTAATPLLGIVLDLGLAVLVGAGLSAVQLLPTLELSRLSIRSGGLTYQEAAAFSLKPLPHLLRYTFLPPWGSNLADVFGGDYFAEYLAYVGAVPLLLAALAVVLRFSGIHRGAVSSLHEKNAERELARALFLAGLGVFLALGAYNPAYWLLYKAVPGFGLFRVPARWLFLYSFGTAMLAGIGLQQVHNRLRPRLSAGGAPLLRWSGRAVGAALAAVTLVELFGAAESLPFSHPTAPEAFSSLRTAPAHILAAQGQEIAPGRVLSMSDIAFDPGDLAEIQQMLGGQLEERAIYDYVVCAKRQEIVAPNLPLAWQIYAVDGYDGGVLPLARYVHIQRLLLEESAILTDGRLREGLERIPPSRLLSILGIRYVITDKVHDVWIDDVFYDLAFGTVLDADPQTDVVSVVEIRDPPRFAATALGVVSYLEQGRQAPDGTPVAEVRLTMENGDVERFVLRAGQDTSEGLYDGTVSHAQARIGHRWRDRPEGSEYVARLRWKTPSRIRRIELAALPFGGQVHIRGLALVDERDGSNVPLIVSTDGRFRQVHSGDVKTYEVVDALPRAHVVHRTRIIADDEASIEAMSSPAFDPSKVAILSSGERIDEVSPGESKTQVTTYEPDQVVVQASLHTPGYLVLSDTWYPGWKAFVDGKPATIERANVGFRAVYVPAGTHTVQLRYRPLPYLVGRWISTVALSGIVLGLIVCWQTTRRNDTDTTGAPSSPAGKPGASAESPHLQTPVVMSTGRIRGAGV